MVNFIIMGEIPGTHIQITFYGLLLGLLITALTVMTVILFRGINTLIRNRPIDINLISI